MIIVTTTRLVSQADMSQHNFTTVVGHKISCISDFVHSLSVKLRHIKNEYKII